ncbi:MAG: hypothetical protein J5858_02110 [Lentisphaeria bacterium]|nr:hypothetical protein [Lentisphaeria bacterium]
MRVTTMTVSTMPTNGVNAPQVTVRESFASNACFHRSLSGRRSLTLFNSMAAEYRRLGNDAFFMLRNTDFGLSRFLFSQSRNKTVGRNVDTTKQEGQRELKRKFLEQPCLLWLSESPAAKVLQ